MEEIVLRCDWCVCKPRKFAVASLSLSNGRITRNTPKLDLCELHRREAYKTFMPRRTSITKTKRKYTRESFAKARAKFDKLWDERKARVMKVLNSAKEPLRWRDFKEAKMGHTALAGALKRLRIEKKIKREGWSKAARWSLT